jgi:hypothetical protein
MEKKCEKIITRNQRRNEKIFYGKRKFHGGGAFEWELVDW